MYKPKGSNSTHKDPFSGAFSKTLPKYSKIELSDSVSNLFIPSKIKNSIANNSFDARDYTNTHYEDNEGKQLSFIII